MSETITTVDGDVDATVSRRRRHTRERLLDAAFDLFADEGVDATSIEAVCERAGFTRGAFYSNFDSKYALLLDLAAREHRRRLQELRSALAVAQADYAQGPTVDVDAMARFLEILLERISDDRRWRVISAELTLLAMRQPDIARHHHDLDRQMTDEVADEIERLMPTLGRRLVLPARQVLRVLAAGYRADLDAADLSGDPQPAARARAEAATWLPTVADRLTLPL
ncbi:TetR/AcrR family transcriptional regulator [Cellulomonas xiejunii]|uniref:TetR/AcrR family transcriptional regulator n=1 Tax=Cellulomonas xiejunii TaxID=2968083 RepID=A0ABY5KN49_9CELL|nr:TetR/AcrR family transcriptional regulator [Cellulomonas xiejunii]MCC2315901.1 TetR/AcrR family transcriptional regulator; helix-turn-helix transcriptional regulator [Cellulomonas xiejunii]MCC2320918.1 TetR/AcrR family transcriptional regulator; helix-turn-helix transcriptional regulator [Cellulomonas xiejunii]UUI71199.1 TetR/AcrR family transcriptional regulator [Cellulomonas xiejunii]